MTTTFLAVTRDPKSEEFFDAAARGVLLIRRCPRCQTLMTSEAATCRTCGSVDLEWIEASGSGHLVSWTAVGRAPIPVFAEAVPYLLGLVELAEGPWMYGRLVGIDESDLRAGLVVRVDFVHPDGSEHYPVFAASTTPEGPS